MDFFSVVSGGNPDTTYSAIFAVLRPLGTDISSLTLSDIIIDWPIKPIESIGENRVDNLL